MKHRFVEAEDTHYTNHGRFSLVMYEEEEFRYESPIARQELLASLPVPRRFVEPISPGCLWMLDLVTQEGMMFQADSTEADLRRRFLVHPIHVCILFFPVMRAITYSNVTFSELPHKFVLNIDDVLNQPGTLLDARGQPVRTRAEWSPRYPLIARLRNRESLEGVDPEVGQFGLTEAEMLEAQSGRAPSW